MPVTNNRFVSSRYLHYMCWVQTSIFVSVTQPSSHHHEGHHKSKTQQQLSVEEPGRIPLGQKRRKSIPFLEIHRVAFSSFLTYFGVYLNLAVQSNRLLHTAVIYGWAYFLLFSTSSQHRWSWQGRVNEMILINTLSHCNSNKDLFYIKLRSLQLLHI